MTHKNQRLEKKHLRSLTLFLLFILYSSSLLFAQVYFKEGHFLIKGHVKNFKESLFDFGMTTYFKKITLSVQVMPDGSFEQQFPIQYRQDLYFFLNNDALPFSVEDKDIIIIEWDDTDFKNSFSIKGKNDLRTKELQQQLAINSTFREPFKNLSLDLYKKRKELSDEDKFTLINELYNQNAKAVFANITSLSESARRHLSSLYFQYTNLLWQEKLLPLYKLNLVIDSAFASQYYDVAGIRSDYKQLYDYWFWNIPEYRDFMYDYLRFFKPLNSQIYRHGTVTKPFNPTLDFYHLAQSVIIVVEIKEWFITKSIIDGFGHYSFAAVEDVYKEFIKTCTNQYLKDTLVEYYTAINRLRPGSIAPVFSLRNESGQTVSLSDFMGKVVYINFWGVSCGPCIYDIKNSVPKLHKQYKDKNVVFINICVDAKEDKWKKALADLQLNGINLIAEGWNNHPVCIAYNISSIPHYVLIDKEGKIADNNAPGPSQFTQGNGKNKIDLLLK